MTPFHNIGMMFEPFCRYNKWMVTVLHGSKNGMGYVVWFLCLEEHRQMRKDK